MPTTETNFGLPTAQYTAICQLVENERQTLYREFAEHFGTGVVPTVAEIAARLERTRDTLVFAFRALNCARELSALRQVSFDRLAGLPAVEPLFTVPFSADDEFCVSRDPASVR
jgi:hypothetical protein